MRLFLPIAAALMAQTLHAEIWTNHLGRAFSARLLAVSDTGVTFQFAEDGVTNTLPFAKLAAPSARRACEQLDFTPIPPALAATFSQALRDLRRLADLLADARITEEAAEARRTGIRAAFAQRCREAALPESDIAGLTRRLMREGGNVMVR